MKRTLALLLAVVMVFALFGCGKSESAPAATAAPAAPAAEAPAAEAPAAEAPAAEEAASGESHVITEPVTIRIASQGSGTSNYVTAATQASLLEQYLPAGSKVIHETISTGVSANGYLLQAGLTDLAGGQNAISAIRGLDGREPFTGVSALYGSYNTVISIQVVNDGFIKKTGYTSFEEIVANKYPARVIAEEVGSSDYVLLQMVLEALGTSIDEMKGWGCTFNFAGGQACADSLQDNQADIMCAHTTPTSSSMNELAMSADVSFFSFSDKILDYLVENGFQRTVVPAGTYNGEFTEDVPTAAIGNCTQVRSDMPFDEAYTITKIVMEHRQFLAEQLGVGWQLGTFKDFTNQESMVVPWHPGAMQYFIDIGVVDENGNYLGEPAVDPDPTFTYGG